MSRTFAVLALALVPTAALAKPKASAPAAGGPKATACGVKVLPLAVGNLWRYELVAAPTAATPEVVRISPPSPKSFSIAVTAIEPHGTDTLISLEEKVTYELSGGTKDKKNIDERVIHSTITCNAKKFDISPESFLFAGEPGGYHGITLDSMDRKGTTWQLTGGLFGTAVWPEDLTGHWTQDVVKGSGAKMSAGKIEIERRTTPSDAELITTKAGSFKTEKLVIKTTGRITLDAPKSPDMKPAEMPADWVNQLWFSEGVGVVQSLSRYAHQYQLVESTLK
jgi:hypothetical protein